LRQNQISFYNQHGFENLAEPEKSKREKEDKTEG
jgi:hypothetical protein